MKKTTYLSIIDLIGCINGVLHMFDSGSLVLDVFESRYDICNARSVLHGFSTHIDYSCRTTHNDYAVYSAGNHISENHGFTVCNPVINNLENLTGAVCV